MLRLSLSEGWGFPLSLEPNAVLSPLFVCKYFKNCATVPGALTGVQWADAGQVQGTHQSCSLSLHSAAGQGVHIFGRTTISCGQVAALPFQTPEGDCIKQVVLTIATGVAAPNQKKAGAEDQWRMTTGEGQAEATSPFQRDVSLMSLACGSAVA